MRICSFFSLSKKFRVIYGILIYFHVIFRSKMVKKKFNGTKRKKWDRAINSIKPFTKTLKEPNRIQTTIALRHSERKREKKKQQQHMNFVMRDIWLCTECAEFPVCFSLIYSFHSIEFYKSVVTWNKNYYFVSNEKKTNKMNHWIERQSGNKNTKKEKR